MNSDLIAWSKTAKLFIDKMFRLCRWMMLDTWYIWLTKGQLSITISAKLYREIPFNFVFWFGVQQMSGPNIHWCQHYANIESSDSTESQCLTFAESQTRIRIWMETRRNSFSERKQRLNLLLPMLFEHKFLVFSNGKLNPRFPFNHIQNIDIH